jgi:SdrD B-like domain
LLSPALQNLFLQDPAAFVNSGNVPPEVKALLDAQVPLNTSIAVNGQFQVRNKLSLAPTFTVARSNSGTAQSWTPYAGYSLIYRPTSTLQLSSGLSDIWVFNNHLAPQRTTILSFGFNKIFSAMPLSAVLSTVRGNRLIQGRVFRDSNLNGYFNAGEQGLENVRVELDNGEVAVTDEQGRYRFTGVSGGEHWVSINLKQFQGPVKMTTRNEVALDMIRQNNAVVDFGVIDFARLMGNVFNDLRFEGKKQLDSRGLGSVHLLLEGGRYQRTIITETNGDFEVHDVPPGNYKLSIDPATLPPNYAAPKASFVVQVAPVTTVVEDIPARALRSIAGRVFLRVAADTPGAIAPQNSAADYKLVPMADIQISAGYGVVKTDANGNFLLRDLPAGDLTITLVPLQVLPEGMKVPAGAVHMPPEPVQIQGATIVISNPELVPYLVGKTAAEVRANAVKLESKSSRPAVEPAPAIEPASKPAGIQPASAEKTKVAGGTP